MKFKLPAVAVYDSEKSYFGCIFLCYTEKRNVQRGTDCVRCIFCKEPSGFFKAYHDDCYNKVQAVLGKMEQIVNEYTRRIHQ